MKSNINPTIIRSPLAGEIPNPDLRDFFLRIQHLGPVPERPPFTAFDLLNFERHIPCTVLCLCSEDEPTPVVQFNGSEYVQATGSDHTSGVMSCTTYSTQSSTYVGDALTGKQPLFIIDNPLPTNKHAFNGYDSIICPLFSGPDVVAVIARVDFFR